MQWGALTPFSCFQKGTSTLLPKKSYWIHGFWPLPHWLIYSSQQEKEWYAQWLSLRRIKETSFIHGLLSIGAEAPKWHPGCSSISLCPLGSANTWSPRMSEKDTPKDRPCTRDAFYITGILKSIWGKRSSHSLICHKRYYTELITCPYLLQICWSLWPIILCWREKEKRGWDSTIKRCPEHA